MSLTLLQGYSSAEEEPAEGFQSSEEEGEGAPSSLSDQEGERVPPKKNRSAAGVSNFPYGSPSLPSNSLLPSALDVFSEVALVVSVDFLCLERSATVLLTLVFSSRVLLSGGFRAAGFPKQLRGGVFCGIKGSTWGNRQTAPYKSKAQKREGSPGR